MTKGEEVRADQEGVQELRERIRSDNKEDSNGNFSEFALNIREHQRDWPGVGMSGNSKCHYRFIQRRERFLFNEN